jgi:DNA-binding LacI/PurR family transcriptional regulator
MSPTTLADVAKRVGVSAKTVSNVVNHTGWVGDEVRAKVEAAIRELDYRPNLAARHLRQGKTGLIALALPDLKEPYFAELASYFVAAAQQRDATVLISQTGGERTVELGIVEGESLPAADAVVLSPLTLTEEDLARRRSTTPLVLLGEHAQATAPEGVPHLGVNNPVAAGLAVGHLIERGRRRIAAVGLQSSGRKDSAVVRFEGYTAALAQAGLPVDPALTREVEHFSRAEGAAAVEALVESGVAFDAVFCFNDSMAFGALTTLARHGRRVPDDVAVVGFDDVDEAAFTVPPLTTVGPSPRVIADRLFDLIDHRDENPTGRHVIAPELIVRASS